MKEGKLEQLFKDSLNNRDAVEKQQQLDGFVACYYCVEFMPATEISQYCLNEKKEEKTAICPRCFVDLIIAQPISMATLRALNKKYFKDTE